MPDRRLRVCDHPRIAGVRRTSMLFLAALLVLGALPVAAAAASATTLGTYGTLTTGQSIVSPDGHYELVMQSDGNLVESIAGGRALWSSHTNGNDGAHAVMQAGGNLAVYNLAGAAVFSSNSRAGGCPQLVIQNDGNLVIYSPRAIWRTRTVQSIMRPGDVLRSGWSIYSPNEDYQLIMETGGDLVLLDGAGKALWSSPTGGHPGAYATLKPDGNLVVYPPTGSALWSTKTYKDGGAYLSLKSDGNLVLYKGSRTVWSTKTYNEGSGGSLAPRRPAAVTSCPPPAPPPPPPPPPTPVMNTPVTTQISQPPAPHALAVKLRISWTWNHAVTRLHGTKIGMFPGQSQIFIQCHGRGCPGKRDISSRGFFKVLRLLRNLRGNLYRAGDNLMIILKAPGYLPERALVKIRDGRLPAVIRLPLP